LKTAAVEIKGSIITVLVLQVNDTDADLLSAQLTEKISKGSAIIANSPVLIDLQKIDQAQQCDFDLGLLIAQLRDLGVVPVAVRGAAACLEPQALAAGIGLLAAGKTGKGGEPGEAELATVHQQPHEPELNSSAPVKTGNGTGYKTKVITQPVRSGQQIFSHGDLIILSSVNPGAEIVARGNIHVYGALRGRAMAGVDGDEDVRIFCLQCNPELIAVAGDYMVNESLDRSVVNQSVMISRDADGLIFSPLAMGNGKR